jgi:hypothetical protein
MESFKAIFVEGGGATESFSPPVVDGGRNAESAAPQSLQGGGAITASTTSIFLFMIVMVHLSYPRPL